MSPADKTKLDGLGNADLGYTASAANGIVTNSVGDDATIPLVGTDAGLMSPADKTKLDGLMNADLGYTAGASDGLVTNSAGDDATIPAVSESAAGLMTPDMLARLDAVEEDAYDDEGDYVNIDDQIATFFVNDTTNFDRAKDRFLNAIQFSDDKPDLPPTIYTTIA